MKINSIEIKNIEPIKTIAIHHIGDYSGIGTEFQKLGDWADKNDYWGKGPLMAGIYHDDPRGVATEKLRSSACLEDIGGMEPGPGMERYEISGGKYFVMTAELTMDEFYEAWKQAYSKLLEQGYECENCDHYELYIAAVDGSQGEDAPWIVEFRIPVK